MYNTPVAGVPPPLGRWLACSYATCYIMLILISLIFNNNSYFAIGVIAPAGRAPPPLAWGNWLFDHISTAFLLFWVKTGSFFAGIP